MPQFPLPCTIQPSSVLAHTSTVPYDATSTTKCFCISLDSVQTLRTSSMKPRELTGPILGNVLQMRGPKMAEEPCPAVSCPVLQALQDHFGFVPSPPPCPSPPQGTTVPPHPGGNRHQVTVPPGVGGNRTPFPISQF